MSNNDPSWGTVKQAAEKSGLHVMTIYRYIDSGLLTARRQGVRRIQVDLNSVDNIFTPIEPTQEAAK